MNKCLVKCGFVGGIVVFVWMMISWMVLPWHTAELKRFQNEQRVADVLRDNAGVSGVYILPNVYKVSGSEESVKRQMSHAAEIMDRGPVMFAAVNVHGISEKSASPFIKAVIIDIVGAFLICWFLMQTKAMKYWKQVRFVTLVGVVIALLGEMPAWNWWGFPFSYMLTCAFDQVIGWFLAGLVIVKLRQQG